MSKVEMFTQVIKLNEEKISNLELKLEQVEETKRLEVSEMFNRFFSGCIVEGDTIKVSSYGSEQITFNRLDEDKKYSKELMSLRFRSSWNSVDEEGVPTISTSFYSTSENSLFELNRMILIGKVAEVLVDFQDDILAEFETIKLRFKDEIKALRKDIYALEEASNEARAEIKKIEEDALMEKLFNQGITFKTDKVRDLPVLDIRFDYRVYGVQKIKVTDKTASGKSANISLEIATRRWNPDRVGTYVEIQTRTFEKVRMSKVRDLVLCNTKSIA